MGVNVLLWQRLGVPSSGEIRIALEAELAALGVWKGTPSLLPEIMIRVEVLRLRDMMAAPQESSPARDLTLRHLGRQYQILQGLLPIWGARFLCADVSSVVSPDWRHVRQLVDFSVKYHDVGNALDGLTVGANKLVPLPIMTRLRRPRVRGAQLLTRFPAREAYAGRLTARPRLRSRIILEHEWDRFWQIPHLQAWIDGRGDLKELPDEARTALMLLAIHHVESLDSFLPRKAVVGHVSVENAREMWAAVVFATNLIDLDARTSGSYWPVFWQDAEQAATWIADTTGVVVDQARAFVTLLTHREETDVDAALSPLVVLDDGVYAFGSLVLASNIERNLIRLVYARRLPGGRIGNLLGVAGERRVRAVFADISGVRILTRQKVYSATTDKPVAEFDLVAWSQLEGCGLVVEVKSWPGPDGYREGARLIQTIAAAQAKLLEGSRKITDGEWRYERKQHVPNADELEWNFCVIGPSYFSGAQLLESPIPYMSLAVLEYEKNQLVSPPSLQWILDLLKEVAPPIGRAEYSVGIRKYKVQELDVFVDEVVSATAIPAEYVGTQATSQATPWP